MFEYLTNLGFKPFRIMNDKNNPRYRVWCFDNTVELEKARKDYFNDLRRRNLVGGSK